MDIALCQFNRCSPRGAEMDEGHEEVTVLGVWGTSLLIKSFAIIEASDFAAVTTQVRGQSLIGIVEVTPVNDNIATRKQRGHWGK